MAGPAAAAAVSAAASLAGSALDYKAQKKAIKQAEEDRAANIGFIEQFGGNAIESLTPAYQNAQNIQQQAANRGLGLTGQIFKPMVNTIQDADYMAQQAAIAGLMGQRNAILGDSINYGALQAQRVPVNFSALTGLTNPQTLDYASFEVPEYGASSNTQAQENWTDFSARSYLNANPDIEIEYNKIRPQLLAGGDPQFVTIEGYATWHYDNYGKQEGRLLSPNVATANNSVAKTAVPANKSAPKAAASFKADQVRIALNAGMGGFEGEGEEYGRTG